MKKSLFLVATAALVISCANNDVRNEIVESEVPIGFTKVYIEKGTKAITTGAYTTANFETLGNTFGVFAFKQTASQTDYSIFGTTTTDGVTTINDVEVEYKNGLSTDIYEGATDWAYSPLKYWDKTATEYNFFAYAPHQSDFTGTAAITGSKSAGFSFSITGFEQATTQASMIDLMTDMTSQKSVTNSTTKKIGENDVAFTFGHILSNINVEMAVSPALKLDNTANPVTVVSVSLGDIKMDGTYNYSTSASAWTLSETPNEVAFAGTQTSGNVFASDALKAVDATADDGGFTAVPAMTNLLFVPQSVNADYAITIQYKIGVEVFDKTIKLSEFKNASNSALATWASGYKYTYRIVIGPNPILFDITAVSEWGTGGVYTYTID